jgi:hypothetical protein
LKVSGAKHGPLILLEREVAMISRFKVTAMSGVAALALVGAAHYAEACTRIFANDKGGAMLVARSMDWATTTEPVLTVFPPGPRPRRGQRGSNERGYRQSSPLDVEIRQRRHDDFWHRHG